MRLTTDQIERLASVRTINLTTFGRTTGLPRRIEIWWFRVGDRFVITGTPGRRDWVANIMANPRVIVHVDGMDIETTVSVITDKEQRLEVFKQPETRWYSSQAELEHLLAAAPMIAVQLPTV